MEKSCNEENGYVCAILIHKNHINLEFWQGAKLQDPKNLLEGNGKKIRHIKIIGESDIDTKYVKKLLKEYIKLNMSS